MNLDCRKSLYQSSFNAKKDVPVRTVCAAITVFNLFLYIMLESFSTKEKADEDIFKKTNNVASILTFQN